jgi:uncharacterized membrane protein
MPFCSQCGNQVVDRDIFCARCGARQPIAPEPAGNVSGGLSPRTAAVLCYVPGLGWIAAVIVLASNSFRADRMLRFHAFQGLYLFVAFLVNAAVLRPFEHVMMPIPHLSGIVELALLVASIFMMVKVGQGNTECALPLFGELAHRSADEH